MKVLVTGGAGFLGGNLAAALRERGDRVRILDFPNTVLDVERVNMCVEDADVVVHMASVAGVPTVVGAPAHTMQVTLEGTANVLHACKRFGVSRLVNVSTSEVYGPYAWRAAEGDATTLPPVGESPRWSYAMAKLAAEQLCQAYRDQESLDVVNVRPCNIYGPGQVGVGAVNNFMRAAIAGRPLLVEGDGNQLRSWCYVDDFTRFMLRAVDEPTVAGEVFNVGNPSQLVTVSDLARLVLEATGSGSPILWRAHEYPDVELRVLSIEKAGRLLGWQPTVSLPAGLRLLHGYLVRSATMDAAPLGEDAQATEGTGSSVG